MNLLNNRKFAVTMAKTTAIIQHIIWYKLGL